MKRFALISLLSFLLAHCEKRPERHVVLKPQSELIPPGVEPEAISDKTEASELPPAEESAPRVGPVSDPVPAAPAADEPTDSTPDEGGVAPKPEDEKTTEAPRPPLVNPEPPVTFRNRDIAFQGLPALLAVPALDILDFGVKSFCDETKLGHFRLSIAPQNKYRPTLDVCLPNKDSQVSSQSSFTLALHDSLEGKSIVAQDFAAVILWNPTKAAVLDFAIVQRTVFAQGAPVCSIESARPVLVSCSAESPLFDQISMSFAEKSLSLRFQQQTQSLDLQQVPGRSLLPAQTPDSLLPILEKESDGKKQNLLLGRLAEQLAALPPEKQLPPIATVKALMQKGLLSEAQFHRFLGATASPQALTEAEPFLASSLASDVLKGLELIDALAGTDVRAIFLAKLKLFYPQAIKSTGGPADPVAERLVAFALDFLSARSTAAERLAIQEIAAAYPGAENAAMQRFLFFR